MNISKALENLKDNRQYIVNDTMTDLSSIDLAIQSLEKQIPMKPVRSSYNVAFCPVCNGSLWQNKDESNYCFRCGQKIEW